MTEDKRSLDGAYSLKTPEDSVALYRDWAASYDAEFADAMDYRMPGAVAALYAEAGGRGPVLDVGAGTGILGVALRAQGIETVDGIDISPEMLEVAQAKGAYRACLVANVLEPMALQTRYAGLVSSGTFTAGHVGPEALVHLLAVAAPGALFALAINTSVFVPAGFEQALAKLEASGQITGLSLPERRYYGPGGTGDHKDDIGIVALFHRV